MLLTTKAFGDLTAADVMSRDVVTIPHRISLRAAAHVLRRADVTGAPVVDAQGRCVGVLSAVDFLRWVEEKGAHTEPRPIRTCRYQTEGPLLTGKEAVICTLAPGGCSLQAVQPTTGGRHTAVCLMPHDVFTDSQLVPEEEPEDEVGRYMTKGVVTAPPGTPLTDLAEKMIDGHIHRVVVTDEGGWLLGIVSATQVLAAVARQASRCAGRGGSNE